MAFNVYTKVPLTYLTDTKRQVDEDIFEESERKGKDAKHITRIHKVMVFKTVS